jgi:cytochrome c biogenesis protein CcmG/thiol:disulfide interchange protein DsbE
MKAVRTNRLSWRVATVAALVAVVLTALLAVGCSDAPQPNPSPTKRLTLPPSPTALPPFTPAEFRALLASMKGTPVVMNIWASWCGPCTAEAPGLARVARDFKGKAQFVGVDIIDHLPPARAFIRKYGWPYPSVFDPRGAIRDDFGFIGQPVTVVFDRAGNVALTHSGPISEDILRTAVEDAVSA